AMRRRIGGGSRELVHLSAHATERPRDRVVMSAHPALLERDDRVVRDVDVLRADLGAALGDVAEADAVLRADEVDALVRVERMHLERRESDEQPRAGEASLVLLVIADNVANVLAE